MIISSYGISPVSTIAKYFGSFGSANIGAMRSDAGAVRQQSSARPSGDISDPGAVHILSGARRVGLGSTHHHQGERTTAILRAL